MFYHTDGSRSKPGVVTVTDLIDGTSNTLMLGESLMALSANDDDWRGGIHNDDGVFRFHTITGPNSPTPDIINPSYFRPNADPLMPAVPTSDDAKQVAADRPGDKTAVVLVSDGEPGFFDAQQNAFVPGCPDNDVAHAAAVAKAAFEGSPSVPTYVIGVGAKLDALNSIATAGGTKSAVIVDTANPAKTKTDIVGALAAIRRSEVSCDFSIPPAPAGQELDPYAVNVVLQQADGTEKVLGYNKGCATAEGWTYDNVAAPKRILLCANACTSARSAAVGKVSIAFGCKTHVAVN